MFQIQTFDFFYFKIKDENFSEKSFFRKTLTYFLKFLNLEYNFVKEILI